MGRFRQPEFLTTRDEPSQRLRCPIHGFIHFSENERAIIDHPLFQRLRFVRQLALTELVYPGATHTRFEHSLGVMELATRFFDALCAKNGELIEERLKEVRGFEEDPLALARQVLRLAALLHDVGHAPFSHAAESVYFGEEGHESLTEKVILEPDLIGGEIMRLYGPDISPLVVQVIRGSVDLAEGSSDLAPQLQFLNNLVSGEMDADRTDYLLRDSHHCGVDYGRFDHRRMIETLEIVETGLDTLEIGLHRDGIHTFEALILARYQMNTQVYLHRLRRIYDHYLEEYHRELGDGLPKTVEGILRSNDVTMLAMIHRDAQEANGKRQALARRIRDRDHHRVVYDTGGDADWQKLQRAERALAELEKARPEREFLLVESPGKIHKLFIPGDQEPGVELALVLNDGTKRLVVDESRILPRIPRQFRRVFIFADLKHDEKVPLTELREFAAKQMR